ncbi:MAG: bifunctional aspartate kinase/homoserine dehydrogenase I, partial [Terriglobus roseus]|nr:bifunctional aspartate kinase/homoserine dehydrogenase I [Terriglobus roseus]
MGKCFLGQLSQLAQRLSQASSPIYLSLILLASSKKVLTSPNYHHLGLSSCVDDLQASDAPPMSPAEIVEFLSRAPEQAILVDNTSSQDVADAYPLFLAKGISVVTPNKKAFSGDLKLWNGIFGAAANGTTGSGGYVFHEASVGAGLPVISTLKELVETGDEVVKVEGVFSGTMS